MKKKLLFAINVDWYFNLHWRERLLSKMASGYILHLCLSETVENNFWGELHFHKLSLSRSSTGIWSNLKTLWGAIRIFLNVKPDALHCVTVKPNIMFGILAFFFRKPVLITIPGLGTIFSADGVKAKIVRRFILLMYRLISKNDRAFFVFENKSDLALFKNRGICSGSNSAVVPGAGVNIERFKKAPLLWETDQCLHLLFAARLLKKKGLYELVAAVTELREEGLPVILNVAGLIDRDSKDPIPTRQVELWHQQGKINWLGQVEKIETAIAANHVVVLPTRYGEGMPRILLEANACGRPVIATDIPGCNNFVVNNKNGILVEPGNKEELKNAIRSFNDKEYCIALGEKGRQLVEHSYTDRDVIDCYRQIYSDKLRIKN